VRLMKEKLHDLIYILLRDSLTVADIEWIMEEIKSGVSKDSKLISLCADIIMESIGKSNLKCYDNMCNTQDDDVKMVRNMVSVGSGINHQRIPTEIPMCADCRRRNPEAVLLQD